MAVAVTMAFFLGDIAGYHGAAVFSKWGTADWAAAV